METKVTFKVNDKVIGKENNGMAVTNEEVMLNVDEIIDEKNFRATIVAKLTNGIWKKVSKKNEFPLLPIDRFVLATPEQVAEAFPVKASKEKITDKCKFSNGFVVTTRVDGSIESNFNRSKTIIEETDSARRKALMSFVEAYTNSENFNFIQEISKADYAAINGIFSKEALRNALDKLIAFFKEFEFTPSIRFANTLARTYGDNFEKAKKYVYNYFALCASPYADSVCEKVKSMEFKDIYNQLVVFSPNKVVNSRLKIYYGAPGAGKTYTASNEASGRIVICNSSIEPADILEDFTFDDGKPTYKGSILKECITKGLSVCLDEFNRLPSKTLFFIQGLTDGKESFIYKGETIHVHPGFQIIGTMNLFQNGIATGLNEALIDRASELTEFEMTADILLNAFDCEYLK